MICWQTKNVLKKRLIGGVVSGCGRRTITETCTTYTTVCGGWFGRWAVLIPQVEYNLKHTLQLLFLLPFENDFLTAAATNSPFSLRDLHARTHTHTGHKTTLRARSRDHWTRAIMCARAASLTSRAIASSDPLAPGWILSSSLNHFRFGILTKPLRPAL